MKSYHINRAGEERAMGEVTVRVVDATKSYNLTPDKSLKARNHSPTGFEFGYCGSGPAQLALAILMDYTGQGCDEWSCPWKYQDFKTHFIAPMDHPGGVILGSQIDEWLVDHKRQNEKA